MVLNPPYKTAGPILRMRGNDFEMFPYPGFDDNGDDWIFQHCTEHLKMVTMISEQC